MDEKRFEELTKIAQNNPFQQQVNDFVIEVKQKHHKIIDDWCRAYMSELYEDGHEIRPGMFVLNEQMTNNGYKFWFTLKGENER